MMKSIFVLRRYSGMSVSRMGLNAVNRLPHVCSKSLLKPVSMSTVPRSCFTKKQ